MSLFIELLRFLSLEPWRRILHSAPCCWRTNALHHTDWPTPSPNHREGQTGTTPRQNTHLQNNFKFCFKEQKRIKMSEDESKTSPKHLNKSEITFLKPTIWIYISLPFCRHDGCSYHSHTDTDTCWSTHSNILDEWIILKNTGCSGKHPASSSVIPVTVWLVWIKSYDHTSTLQLHA